MKKLTTKLALFIAAGIIFGLLIGGCSKEKEAPQPIVKEVIINTNTHTTDTVYIDTTTCDTITPEIITKTVRLELNGGNNNTANYSSNGDYVYVSTQFYRYEFELDANEFLQLDASFMQLYGTNGGGPLYPWLSISIIVDGVLIGTYSELTSYIGYTYINDHN